MPTDREKLKLWLERFQKSEEHMRPSRDRGKENYKLYKMYKADSEKIYKHDIFVPYAFAFLEDLAAYFMLSIIAAPQVYSIDQRWLSVPMSLCKALEAIVNWAIQEEKAEFVLEIEEMLKHINIYNAAYLINYPVTMNVNVIGPDGRVMRNKKTNTVQKVDAYDYLYLDAPHPFLMYPEVGAKRLSRARWLIKQSFEDFETLKEWERQEIYKDIKEVSENDQTNEQNPVQELLSEIGLAPVDWNEKKIELLDCFQDGDVVTIANRRAIIRDTTKDATRPYSFDLPVLDCRFAGAPGEFEGMGAMQVTKPLNKDLNTLRSQRRDNVALILNKLFKYNMLAGEVDLTTLYSAPGNVILMQGDCVDEFEITDVTASSYREEQSLIYDLQSVLSFWDYGRGATPRRKETATGIIRLQQAAQARNEWHLRKLDEYILQPLCRRIITYIHESLPLADAKAIVGPEYFDGIAMFYDLDPKDIRRLIHIRPLTESITSIKELDINMFLQAYDRLIQVPGVNVPALVKVLLQKLQQRNVKEILGALNSPDAQARTAQALQQMQAGDAGAATQAQTMGFLGGGEPEIPASPIQGMAEGD